MAIPRLIAPAKRLLEMGFTCPGYQNNGYQSYESNIDFEIRYSCLDLMKSFAEENIFLPFRAAFDGFVN